MSVIGLEKEEMESLLDVADSVAEDSAEDAVKLLKLIYWNKYSTKEQKIAALKKVYDLSPNLDVGDSVDAYMFVGARMPEDDPLKMESLRRAVEAAAGMKNNSERAKTLDSIYHLAPAPVPYNSLAPDFSNRNALMAHARELGIGSSAKAPDSKSNAHICG